MAEMAESNFRLKREIEIFYSKQFRRCGRCGVARDNTCHNLVSTRYIAQAFWFINMHKHTRTDTYIEFLFGYEFTQRNGGNTEVHEGKH